MLPLPPISINIFSPVAQIKYFQVYIIAFFIFNFFFLILISVIPPHGIGRRTNSQKQIFKERKLLVNLCQKKCSDKQRYSLKLLSKITLLNSKDLIPSKINVFSNTPF